MISLFVVMDFGEKAKFNGRENYSSITTNQIIGLNSNSSQNEVHQYNLAKIYIHIF